MNNLPKAFHLLLLVLIGSFLFAPIESAPLEGALATGEEPAQYLNKDELLKLFQEDAKLASSSSSNDHSSEEWKQNMVNQMKSIKAALGAGTEEPATTAPLIAPLYKL